MPVEATEHAGPVIIWRKELREDSSGSGKFRGGLGQHMEISVREGHEFDFSAMLDRVDHPAHGRQGGQSGAPTIIKRSDGSIMKGKGKQFVPHGQRVIMEFPGGGGYGKACERDPDLVKRDLVRGYISAATAKRDYGFSDEEIADIVDAAQRGESI